jgi:Caspase domain
MRIHLLLLTAVLGLAGCATSLNYVRTHKGEGTRRSLVGGEQELMDKAVDSLRGCCDVHREPHAVFAESILGDVALAFFFYPSTAIGQTDVEVVWAGSGVTAEASHSQERQTLTRMQPSPAPGQAVAAQAPVPSAVPSPEAARSFSSDVDVFNRRGFVRPNDFALIIGIERYETLPKADFGERDAEVFRRYVLGLGVPEENVILLLGPRATKTGMMKYIEEWLPRNVTADSRVFVFYSGHGAPDPATGAAYLVPYDGDPTFLQSSAYPVPRLLERLEALKAKETVVALDACFSGAGGRSVIAKGARPLVVVTAMANTSPKVSVLAASSSDEISGSLDEQGHGLFTYYLLKGLQGAADADGNGHVSLEELHAYVKKSVQREARRQNREQTPNLQSATPGLTLY